MLDFEFSNQEIEDRLAQIQTRIQLTPSWGQDYDLLWSLELIKKLQHDLKEMWYDNAN